MSGTIVFDDHQEWSASSGIFNWVLRFLIDRIEEGSIRDELLLIDEQNFRWLDLTQLDDDGRKAVIQALRSGLVSHAEAKLPYTAHREATIKLIREVVELARLRD